MQFVRKSCQQYQYVRGLPRNPGGSGKSGWWSTQKYWGCVSGRQDRWVLQDKYWCITPATGRFIASVRLLGYVDCLSRVPGDWYARFCGEGVIAISSPYPTHYGDGERSDRRDWRGLA